MCHLVAALEQPYAGVLLAGVIFASAGAQRPREPRTSAREGTLEVLLFARQVFSLGFADSLTYY